MKNLNLIITFSMLSIFSMNCSQKELVQEQFKQGVSHRDVKMVEQALQAGADVNSFVYAAPAIIWAVIFDKLDMVIALVNSPKINIDATSREGNLTALQMAVESADKNENSVNIIDVLLKHGANPNVSGGKLGKPLMNAVYNVHDMKKMKEIIKLLLKYGADNKSSGFQAAIAWFARVDKTRKEIYEQAVNEVREEEQEQKQAEEQKEAPLVETINNYLLPLVIKINSSQGEKLKLFPDKDKKNLQTYFKLGEFPTFADVWNKHAETKADKIFILKQVLNLIKNTKDITKDIKDEDKLIVLGLIKQLFDLQDFLIYTGAQEKYSEPYDILTKITYLTELHKKDELKPAEPAAKPA